MASFSPETIKSVGEILNDRKRPLTERFRALFTLRNIGGSQAVSCISQCFDDPSALLKHELAYCLGQMQDEAAIPTLINVLKDKQQDAMVRHEAGEALGAIGSADVIDLLKQYAEDPVPEVAETCQLALRRIMWLNSEQKSCTDDDGCAYKSVDPAPPCSESNIKALRDTLLDDNADLFTRYRAMFKLRNKGGEESVKALAEGLTCGSALFRHEIAYVLGQMQHPAATQQLSRSLRDPAESPMVRHECAEALGSIATDECMNILKEFRNDPELVVKQSCIVALDMSEYENSDQFEYADGLQRIEKSH